MVDETQAVRNCLRNAASAMESLAPHYYHLVQRASIASLPPPMTGFLRRRLKPGSSSTAEPQTTTDPTYHDTSSPGDIDGLWQDALDVYRRSLGIDLRNPSIPFVSDLEKCRTSDEVIGVLENTARSLARRRRGEGASSRLRIALKPLVYGLTVILDTTAESVSTLVRVLVSIN